MPGESMEARIGRLIGQVDAMDERITRHEEQCAKDREESRRDMKEIISQLSSIRESLAAGGGYRAWAGVGSISGMAGGGIGAAATWFAAKYGYIASLIR